MCGCGKGDGGKDVNLDCGRQTQCFLKVTKSRSYGVKLAQALQTRLVSFCSTDCFQYLVHPPAVH